MMQELHKGQFIAVFFILIALIFLSFQSNPPFFFIFPILLLLLGVSWFLYREIQKDDEEHFKRSVHYMQEEAEAQSWLHKSFVPRTRRLAKKELRAIIVASGVLLMSFIFLWSFFVGGLLSAILNTIIGLLFFLGFIIYTLYAPKEFTHLFRHVPTRYRHHSKNDWVHGYVLLFPFATIGYFLYALTTGEGFLGSLWATIVFLVSYTFLFICVYSVWYLYREYQKEQENH